MLERVFGLKANGTNVRTEVLAGVTTFLTMAYIMFLNPLILADAGMDKGAVFVATCLASAFATLIMALYANYPIALAPGMGINAFFTYGVVIGLHYSWQAALGAVFISGVVALTLSPMMSSRLLKAEHSQGFFPRLIDRAFEFVKRTYTRMLSATLRARPAVYIVWITLSVLIVPMYMFSPAELAPNEDQGVVFGALRKKDVSMRTAWMPSVRTLR